MVSAAIAPTTFGLVRCGVGGHHFGLDMKWVRGILRSDRLRRAPGPAGLVGSLRDGNSDVPVFSLSQRLGLPVESQRSMQHILRIDGASPRGLLVDHVSQV